MTPKRRRPSDDDDDDDDYKQDADDDYDSDKEEEQAARTKKRNTGKKKLDTDGRNRVKGRTKADIAAELYSSVRYFSAPAIDLEQFEVIRAFHPTPFADPAGAPAGGGYKGCQKIEITLGPKQQFGEMGTNASATYPKALDDVKANYHGMTFYSGHMLNADFGGEDSADNMTILTSGANTNQKAFDSNVKNARNTLYGIYQDLVSFNPKNGVGYFTAMGLGIQVTIEMTGNPWGDVKNPNDVFNDAKPSTINYLEGKIDALKKNIAAAMVRRAIDNSSNS
jgi:hypothetical protein